MQFSPSASNTIVWWFLLLALSGLFQGCSEATSGKVVRDFGVAGMTTGSLLHQAAYDGTAAEVLRVINQRADINTHNSVGHTPLHLAAAKGRVEIVKLLLNHGAYINAQNGIGLTPLHMATQYGQRQTIALLLQRGANTELRGHAFGMFEEQVMVLHLAASQEGGAAVVGRLILKAQADVDAKSVDMGLTPLHYAASYNRWHAAAILLNSVSEIDAVDTEGDTPLHYAVRAGAVKVAELLLKMGAAVDIANVDEVTPLQLAAEQDESEMVELLQRYITVGLKPDSP